MTNLAHYIERSRAANPHGTAVRLDDAALSYVELDDLSSRVAGWLHQRGIAPGDRVALLVPNVLAFPVLYYGILRAGAVVVPMNPLLKSREAAYHLADAGAMLVFAWHTALSEVVEAASEVGAEVLAIADDTLHDMAEWPTSPQIEARGDHEPAVILYTSGTTGKPKGAQLTHANLRKNAEVTASEILHLQSNDVIMGCLALFHSFGQTCGLNAAVSAGACLTLIPRFDPIAVLEIIERDRVTVLEGVPTMYVAILSAGPHVADTSSLRTCISGGAAMPVEVLRGFAEAFGVQILEGYGLSETSPVATFNRLEKQKPGSIGYGIDGVELALLDPEGRPVAPGSVGELVIRGHNVMRGYWNRPQATAEAMRGGWFHTGDLAKQDEDGFFYIVDRIKDLIIRGGYNISPREIEEVFYEHPDVLEAAVLGFPHPSHGEEIAAAVALRDGASATVESLREFIKERVAAYKYPRVIWLVESLPKGPSGKILKRQLVVPETSDQ
ncbi:long-chain fatty acid--CoA ligase [Nocardia gipuzkoensis]|uniref:long-chain-fatty-acid--CoA ligase n=1 Tax=Nocardia gipuzkoensis TaxID=2749991 RepID=UPI001E3DF6AD|nr:long-chain fatty acid--CoA ligase [Nocardia gipuzkoensis]UGT67761.1 long-chain fatty acid--CoA ligase [Nocardia gipuzkoensis]